MMENRIYKKELKLDAVRLADTPHNQSEVAQNHGISSGCLGGTGVTNIRR